MSSNRPKLESVQIVRAKGGGPIRTIVEAAKSIPCGDFPSLKAGIAVPWGLMIAEGRRLGLEALPGTERPIAPRAADA